MKSLKGDRSRRRSGFALVSTLLLIAITGVLLVSYSRISVQRSIHVIRQAQDTRTRWATASCQRLVFENLDELLTDGTVDQITNKPLRKRRAVATATIELNQELLTMLIADESAKLDLNLVIEYSDARETRQCIDKLSNRESGITDLYPLPPDKRRGPKDQALETWDQVFRNLDGQPVAPDLLMNSTSRLSCWGKRICLGSASDNVLEEACRVIVGSLTASQVVSARRNFPNANLKDLLAGVSLTDQKRTALNSILGNNSVSQSLWISVHSSAGRRTRYSLTVREGFGDGIHRLNCFAW